MKPERSSLKKLNLPAEDWQAAEKVLETTGYDLLIPDYFLQQIQSSGEDALLRQVWPTSGELVQNPYFTTDPLKEQAPTTRKNATWHLLQKYRGRALLLAATQCFGNCRFCFRRHWRKDENFPREENDFTQEIRTLAEDSSLQEILLSGGDPLTLTDDALDSLLQNLEKIPHLRRIRFHTRVVSFCPSRVSENLLKILKKTKKTLYFVLHINHPAEIGEESRQAIQKLQLAGMVLLQQGVLLRGVNDSLEVLVALYETLANCHVIPYYLHQLDRVAGASHFEVSVEKGQKLMAELRKCLPGYAVPRYVREIPGEGAKVPLEHF